MVEIIILTISLAIIYNIYLYSRGKLAYQLDCTADDKRYLVNEFGKKCPIDIEKWKDDENYCTVDYDGGVYFWKDKPKFLVYSSMKIKGIWFSEEGGKRYYCHYGQKLAGCQMYIWKRPD
jgi:hypothetical protein